MHGMFILMQHYFFSMFISLCSVHHFIISSTLRFDRCFCSIFIFNFVQSQTFRNIFPGECYNAVDGRILMILYNIYINELIRLKSNTFNFINEHFILWRWRWQCFYFQFSMNLNVIKSFYRPKIKLEKKRKR